MFARIRALERKLVPRLVGAGYRLTTFARAIAYLDRCLGNRSPLDTRVLVQKLLPWCPRPSLANQFE